jgi:hypothetical protein
MKLVGSASLKLRHVKIALILNLTICVTIHQARKVSQSVCLVLIIMNVIMTERTKRIRVDMYYLFSERNSHTDFIFLKKMAFVSTSVFVDFLSL